MKAFRSLRLRITLLCALLLTLCCATLTIFSNLSAINLADAVAAIPLEPAQMVPGEADSAPAAMAPAVPAVQKARKIFHTQSLLAAAGILAVGILLIYLLVGRALGPLKDLNAQIQSRTVKDLDHPLSIPDRGDEVTQLAQSFQELSQRLSRAFLMQRSFSQNAAHEFRTPLAILKTRIGLFRKKRDFGPQATEAFLDILEGEVDRLSNMVDSLLKLTNLEQVSRTDRIELQELLCQAADDLSPMASGKDSSIVVYADSGTITGSGELLRRALFNLVENAVKYGPEGGQVQICGKLDGANVRITVSDQGSGIPSDLRERIFEPFFRVDTARSREIGGTGLGLALVRAIAEIHGGSVWVEKDPSGGNRFVLCLPISQS